MADFEGAMSVLSREDWGGGFLVGTESGGGVFDADVGVFAAGAGKLGAAPAASGLFGDAAGDFCDDFGATDCADGAGGV